MSRSADAAVGMMDAAYFVGRKELLDFFNDLLGLNLCKIEQTAPGHIACQLTDMIFPGSIPMSKVHWDAKTDYEYVQNYKLLQRAFSKNHVQRYVDVDKLIKAKYQDNLEMCQWLKAFYDQSGTYRDDYDPVAVRLRGKGGKRYQDMHGARKAGRTVRPTGVKPASTTNKAAPKPMASKPVVPPKVAKEDGLRNSRPLRERHADKNKNDDLSAALDTIKAEKVVLEETNVELESTVAALEEAVLEVEKERDFYFGKLRNIEVLLQIHQEKEDTDHEKRVEDVFKILYATAEDKVDVDEHGEVVEGVDSLDEALESTF